MRPTLRLQNIQPWIVNITPKRVDSLPYSKINAICRKCRRRLLASRTAPATPTGLPPATAFICQPTPSYVLSPQLAASLTKSKISSLKSNLRVYEPVPTGETGVGDVCIKVEEQDCTPEYLIDQGLGGDRALYYGHGQIHVVGMLDMHRTGLKKTQFDSAQRQLAGNLEGLPSTSELSVSNSREVTESWVLRNTENGQRKLARAVVDVDHSDGIATMSVTLNFAVPIPGLDPDRTCPHIRLAAAGIETGAFTSFRALRGRQASNQSRQSGIVNPETLEIYIILQSVWHALGLNLGLGQIGTFVDHARALGERDPDLQPDEDAERRWLASERLTSEEDH